ncbi:SPRY domain-containing protein [Acinetobacter bereziniae]|uniref:SPRY domain-containing protein n=1 Tax=Acinetobacter bereziniae TaxID=106648 RepID=UPI00125065D1|nr:SPRY domain-containing protein [Acinetobacter bereziniae]MBJ9904797.1 hypothetical protein [Acinetobacter bereziniae]MCU4317880.1 hypothetical protein [Acinetobacter bereziniae]MCU4600169.1 hypothetical protein [Acinetobacter bereziniae]
MKVDYQFKVDGYYQSVNYYRSETPMNPESMPLPTAENITLTEFSDTTALANKKYYVRFSSVQNAVEKISEEIEVDTHTFKQTVIFSKWNGVSDIILSNSNKTITYPSGLWQQWFHDGVSVGRIVEDKPKYIEFTIDKLTIIYSNSLAIGISSSINSSGNAGNDGRFQYFSDGRKREWGSYSNYGPAFTVGDRIGIKFSKSGTSALVSFFKNGIDLGVAFTLSASDTFYPVISFYANSTNDTAKLTINEYIVTDPTGLIAW